MPRVAVAGRGKRWNAVRRSKACLLHGNDDLEWSWDKAWEAWEHGSMGAWEHGSMGALVRLVSPRQVARRSVEGTR